MFQAGSFLKDDFAQGVVHIHLMTKSPNRCMSQGKIQHEMIHVKHMEIKKQPFSCISM